MQLGVVKARPKVGQELVSYLAPMDETTELEAIELNEYIDTLSEWRADEQDPLQRGPWCSIMTV